MYDSDNLGQRRKDDVAQYHKHKSDATASVGDDESLYFYVISAKWINLWKKFANGETSQPSRINNKPLVDKIME